MGKLRIILLIGSLSSLLCLQSCARLLGLRDPRKETVEYIYKFYRKARIDTSLVVFVKQQHHGTLETLPSKIGLNTGYQPLQFRVYDPNGKILSHYVNCEGPLGMFDVLDTFPPKNLFPMDTSFTLAGDLALMEMRNGSNVSPKKGHSIIIYSQLWMGKLGKKFVKKVVAYSRKHQVANIYVMNVDER